MPLNPNILALLRQTMSPNAQASAPQGIDPNLEMVLQGMGMMPRRLDMQGRPIVGGVENPSSMDQHYARQANPEAMRQRYSAPTFAMGANDPNRRAPATPLPPQGAITARQPVTGLPGQVGPAYSMQQTPINMFPSPEEGDAMDMVRKQYRQTMRQGSATPAAMPQQASPVTPPAWQGPPAPIDMSFGVPRGPQTPGVRSLPEPQSLPSWQGPLPPGSLPTIPRNTSPSLPPAANGYSSQIFSTSPSVGVPPMGRPDGIISGSFPSNIDVHRNDQVDQYRNAFPFAADLLGRWNKLNALPPAVPGVPRPGTPAYFRSLEQQYPQTYRRIRR